MNWFGVVLNKESRPGFADIIPAPSRPSDTSDTLHSFSDTVGCRFSSALFWAVRRTELGQGSRHVLTWSKPGISSQLFPLRVATVVTVARREEEKKNWLSKGRNLEWILTLKFKVGGPQLAPEKWGWREDARTKSSNGSDECKMCNVWRCPVQFRKMTEEKEQTGWMSPKGNSSSQ